MNEFQTSQSLKILSCYFEKGGIGSGRHKEGKSSVQKLEETNFDSHIDHEQRRKADEIMKFKNDVFNLETSINKLIVLINENSKIVSTYQQANMRKDYDYHVAEGRVKKYRKERDKAIQERNEKKHKIDELNH